VVVAGATYDGDEDAPMPHAAAHAFNLERIARLLPGKVPMGAVYGSNVGFRCVASDRMPLIGTLPDVDAMRARAAALTGAQLPDLPRQPGLYGAFGYASRGLTWAALGGESLASMVEGEPLPLERELADAVDPARFVLKLARRGKLALSDR
jgi:tRNA 5-methylaminomethyl-2-thiouridine biosynthesis bifunctional protein